MGRPTGESTPNENVGWMVSAKNIGRNCYCELSRPAGAGAEHPLGRDCLRDFCGLDPTLHRGKREQVERCDAA